jgi:hypothetical protein
MVFRSAPPPGGDQGEPQPRLLDTEVCYGNA